MISQGLICEPDGCSKYYTDILNEHPGYIPIISSNDEVKIQQALKLAMIEGEHLIPCIIEIDLKKITAGCAFCEDGSEIDISVIKNIEETINALYILSPIPLSCISKVFFESAEQKLKYENDTKILYSNVPLTSLKLEAPKSANKYFSHSTKTNANADMVSRMEDSSSLEEKKELSLPERSILNYNKVYSLGGIIGALFFLTKNGKQSENYFNQFCDLEILESENKDDYDFTLINNYFFYINSEKRNQQSTSIQIIFPILDVIVNESDSKNSIIGVLKSNKFQDKASERANEIANLLLDYSSNKITKPASEIFEQTYLKSKKSKIEMLLLMLFHRNNTEALFEYYLDIFDEIDYILFAILFGIRDKYSGLPLFLKKYEGLQLYISNLMAKYAHKLIDSNLTFVDIKPPPTLNKMLNPGKLEFINWVSKQLELQDCFETVMPNKDFTNSKGKSSYSGIVLPKLEIIKDKYFSTISKNRVDDKLYNKILLKYKKS
jgi:hypothetical protein